MAKTMLGYIMVGPKIPLGINWAYYNEYFQWMLNHETELKNIDNMSYWRSLKNEKERNLPSHGNRSPSWIPSRIMKERKEIINTQLNYLLGEGNFRPHDSYLKDRKCYECGANTSTMQKYLGNLDREVNKIVKNSGNTSFTITDEEHREILEKVMKREAKNFTALEIEKAQIYLPQRGRRRLLDDPYGFCPQCFQDTIEPQLGWDTRLNER